MARDPEASTTGHLRTDADTARPADQAPDPAAAPLGTDDEAAGNPPTEEQRAMEAETRRREAPQRPSAGGDATESLRGADAAAARIDERRGDTAPASDATTGAPETAREVMPERGSEALLSDAGGEKTRPSAEP